MGGPRGGLCEVVKVFFLNFCYVCHSTSELFLFFFLEISQLFVIAVSIAIYLCVFFFLTITFI